MFTQKQRIALILAGATYGMQLAGSWQLYRANKILTEGIEKVTDFANREAYVVMFLITKIAESGVELTEFEQQILADPPKLIDPENPNLYGDFFVRYQETGGNDELIRNLFATLEEIRSADE
jgi:hypothetical protein